MYKRQAFTFVEHHGDCLQPAAGVVSRENQPDRFCCFFYDYDTLCIFVFEITEGRSNYNALFLLLPVAGPHTAAAIARVKVVDKTLEANDEIIVLIERVDIFRRRRCV